jgi:putative CocE/NonD family hydrolase
MIRRFRRIATIVAILGVLAASRVPAATTAPRVTSAKAPGVTCEELRVPMRDGALLTTDVYRPFARGRYPVILQRQPYGFEDSYGCFTGDWSAMARLAEHGYIGIDQEARGTFHSEGRFAPSFQEARDGYDAVEWAAAQPWSSGKVGMTGCSYSGITQLQTAPLRPPHLAAIAPCAMGSDYHDGINYVNGVFSLWLNASWAAESIVPDQMSRAGASAARVAAWNARVNHHLTTWVRRLPLVSPGFTTFAPFYDQWASHPGYDADWARIDTSTRYRDVGVPALVTGAWYDVFQTGTLQNFLGLRARAGSAAARAGTRLVMEAYGHAGDSGAPTFGDDAPDASIKLRFFDHYLKGLDNGFERDPIVHLYVLVPPDHGTKGRGFWITGSAFPLPGTQTIRYVLRSGGHANSRLGDGVLERYDAGRASPGDAGADHFVYDPASPVPTQGGNMCCDGDLLPAGARDQEAVELRRDVLVYSSAPLRRNVAVVGPLDASFWAVTSARDTDFTVKLVDVHPDGRSHNVLDRIVRARYRRGSRLPPELISPNQPYRYRLELGSTATIFRVGHRLRVEISSSNFPQYARNLNTGLDNNRTAEIAVAHQTILHDREHPSFIELPVVPNLAIPGTR